jgi:hypothetical protein
MKAHGELAFLCAALGSQYQSITVSYFLFDFTAPRDISICKEGNLLSKGKYLDSPRDISICKVCKLFEKEISG